MQLYYGIRKSVVYIVLMLSCFGVQVMLTACSALQQHSETKAADLRGVVTERKPGNPDNGMTTVFLVRHAERLSQNCDPINPNKPCPALPDRCLSSAGKTRAEHLVQVLKKADIKAIYSTYCNRTWETAQPLADALSTASSDIEVPIKGYTSVSNLVENIRSRHAGEKVVVTSHSGTIGPSVYRIIEALNGSTEECLIGDEFDNLCVVLYKPDKTEVINLQYGMPSNGRADLIVVSLTHRPARPKTTDLIKFRAVVKNIGEERAGPSTLSFRLDGEPEPTKHDIPALNPGKTYAVRRQKKLTGGRYRNTAIADVKDDVLESNESNNSRTNEYTVLKPNGEPCSRGGECQSGHCVDRTCCQYRTCLGMGCNASCRTGRCLPNCPSHQKCCHFGGDGRCISRNRPCPEPL